LRRANHKNKLDSSTIDIAQVSERIPPEEIAVMNSIENKSTFDERLKNLKVSKPVAVEDQED